MCEGDISRHIKVLLYGMECFMEHLLAHTQVVFTL